MCRVLIFGGTTEGRILAEFCEKSGIPATVSVATEYGAALLPEDITVHCGRLDLAQMCDFLTLGQFSVVVDATHPYAREASSNIRGACEICKLPYLRLKRENNPVFGEIAKDMTSLIKRLNATDGNILSTLGSKSLPEMTKIRDYQKRLWVRILPVQESFRICRGLEIPEHQIIAEKPPFSVEDNLSHIQRSGAKILVTKESGSAGGYREKCEASRIMGITMLTLIRPAEDGMTLSEIEKRLEMEV